MLGLVFGPDTMRRFIEVMWVFPTPQHEPISRVPVSDIVSVYPTGD